MTQFASTPHNALIDAYQALTALQRARVQEGEVNTALARDLKALPAPFTANVKAIQAQLRDVRICRMICYNSEDSVFAISAKALDMICGGDPYIPECRDILDRAYKHLSESHNASNEIASELQNRVSQLQKAITSSVHCTTVKLPQAYLE